MSRILPVSTDRGPLRNQYALRTDLTLQATDITSHRLNDESAGVDSMIITIHTKEPLWNWDLLG